MIEVMTVPERIESQSFCYDAQFPPDVAEGLPLSAARPRRPVQPTPFKRVIRSCARAAGAVTRKR